MKYLRSSFRKNNKNETLRFYLLLRGGPYVSKIIIGGREEMTPKHTGQIRGVYIQIKVVSYVIILSIN